ncbi:biopolymer transporter ExbD [Marinimicrobium sp. ABcell2]|uniref:ExbD/TolR family protein n=1 Tax=Marinimicrobium sp. ABcell2 TaxID=3069751 RepID=UPI0027AF9B8C|nr:biopolymer transporter ExbD [Marinimicrobium sp. ABcell2]MDQ2076645.1 biopolymer transporter ExbD [Marinimicrobium sp. ABcell2]
MTRRRLRHKNKSEAELDITSFLNLMIILVPVLLMSMVFARITVLELTLPESSDGQSESQDQPEQLEVVIGDYYLDVNYPAGTRVQRIEQTDVGAHDYAQLSKLLQNIKVELRNRGIDKDDIVILSQPDTDYQTLVSVMDTVRSYKAVVAASVVDAALFPSVSLGDAPAGEAP